MNMQRNPDADPENPTKGDTSSNDEDFMAKARERYKERKEYWEPKYGLSADDKRFFAGNSENGYQWPAEITNRLDPKRPRLTINRLPQFHNQIVNDYRQASISMRAAPQGEEDKDVAYVYAGLFKQIEKQSYAQVAYITALSDAAIGGLGWLRVVSDYQHPMSFHQDLYIKRVVNPANVIFGPGTGFFLEDAPYAFYLDKMPYEEYEEEYGDDPDSWIFDDEADNWRDKTEKTVIIAEYFYFKTRKRVLCLFEDGSTLFEDEIKKGATDPETGKSADDFIIKRRKVDAKELHWCKMSGDKVLERAIWPKPRIPFIPVWGNELWIDDERQFEGQVRGVKDSQRMYNYMQSTKTEMIALSPKAPYIAAEGQLEGREEEWRDAAATPKSVLYYKPTSVDGVIVPPPQRQSYEAPVQAIIQASMQASDDMKAVLGVYDASLGARGNEVSGRAINARKQEGDTATYNYVDNLSMAVGYLGTVIAELIPVYYDAKRKVRIITPDEKTVTVGINGEKEPDLVNVQYDLVLDTGPSYSTQMQEATATIVELSNNYPKLMELGGDIAIGNMNFKGAREIADRLKRTIPPQIIGDDEDAETKLAAATQELEKAKQVVQTLTDTLKAQDADLTEARLAVKNKAGELRIKQQELSIRRMELNMKREETSGDKSQTTNEENAVIAAIADLAAQVDELADMVETAVSGEPAAPASEEISIEGAPPADAASPVSDQP